MNLARPFPLQAAPRIGDELEVPAIAPVRPSAPDVVTIASYALGVWWCFGGPTWAGVASILGDEIDGRLARATGTQSERGSALDWGADIALTPLALYRLGKTTGHVPAALAAAPPILYAQATMRARGERPSIGSTRALIMGAAMLVEAWK